MTKLFNMTGVNFVCLFKPICIINGSNILYYAIITKRHPLRWANIFLQKTVKVMLLNVLLFKQCSASPQTEV